MSAINRLANPNRVKAALDGAGSALTSKMCIRDRAFRVLVAIADVALLLSPGWLMATVFTSLNFVVALGAILGTLLMAFCLPRWRWIGALLASFLIAVPPYPYWMHADEERGWYFDFFGGFSRSNLPAIGTFCVVFVLSLLLFAAIFWAIGKRPRTTQPAQAR